MIKIGKRSISFLLVIALTLGLFAVTVVFAVNARADDAFSAMYDSGELAQNKVARMDMMPLEDAQRDSASREALVPDGLVDIGFTEDRLDNRAEDFQTRYERVMSESLKQNRYIVKYKPASRLTVAGILAESKANTKNMGIDVAETMRTSSLPDVGQSRMELITLPERVNPKDFADILKAAGVEREILYIQPDFTLLTDSLLQESDEEEETEEAVVPELLDEISSDESELFSNENAEEIAESLQPSSNVPVLVAVIDTGVDTSHHMLEDYVTDGWNAVDQTGVIYDPSKPGESAHGTHIAGLIADTARQTGADVTILPIKAFQNGQAYTSDILAAIAYAESQGAGIINCSFGSTAENRALYEAIDDSNELFVCAAGNARRDLAETPVYPACYDLPNVLSVASCNADGGFSYFSNYGPVDMAALGRQVESAMPGGQTGKMTGTSQAAGYVTGAAAAALSLTGTEGASDLRAWLLYTADRLDNLENKVIDGRHLNLGNALSGNAGASLSPYPADDFDVHGYQPGSPSEWFSLYGQTGDVVQIAAGGYHTLILKEDGSVWSFGNNNYGQLGNGDTLPAEGICQVVGLTDIIAIDANETYSLALDAYGTVYAWGDNSDQQLGPNISYMMSDIPLPALENEAITVIGAGLYHSLVSDGYCFYGWGDDHYGQTGNHFSPIEVDNVILEYEKLAGGYEHSVALTEDGSVWTWGFFNHDDIMVEPEILDLENVVDIAAGLENSLAVTEDGDVYTWQWAKTGPLWQVDGLSDIVMVDMGAYYNNVALDMDGDIWTWENWGMPDLYSYIGDMGTVAAVAAGSEHIVALDEDGNIWAWGDNSFGQLGLSEAVLNFSEEPILVMEGTGQLFDPVCIAVAAGAFHNLMLEDNGTVWAFGHNENGQLGDGTTASRTTPVQVDGLTEVTAITAGTSHSLAITDDGMLWAWGDNSYGQLGDGTTAQRVIPVQVIGLTDVIAVSAGDGFSLALLTDGTIWAFGYNGNGQLGDGTTTNSAIPVQVDSLTNVMAIAAGTSHSLALLENNKVWTWGGNGYGELGDGTTIQKTAPVQVSGLIDITAIAAGTSYSLAVDSSGSAWAWGNNDWGQLGDGTTTHNTTPVQVSSLADGVIAAADFQHSIVGKTNGKVLAWGYNDCGQVGDGTRAQRMEPVEVKNLRHVTAIDAGNSHSIALRADGTVWIWGRALGGILSQPYRGRNLLPKKVQITADDYPDSANLARVDMLIDAPLVYRGGIQTEPDLDWFAFKPDVDKDAKITLNTSDSNVMMEVYNKNLNPLALPNDNVIHVLGGQVYYIKLCYDPNALSYSPASYTLRIAVVYEEDTNHTPVSLAFEKSIYSKNIPVTESITTAVAANAFNVNDLTLHGAEITYSLDYPGVSIDSSTGVITISSAALPGTVILHAEYDGLTTGAELRLTHREAAHFTPNPKTLYAVSFIQKCQEQQYFINEVERLLNLEQKTLNTISGPSAFDNIKALGLMDAGINGILPEAIGEFHELRFLWLSGNQLSGQIPNALFTLSHLQEIDLAGNNYTGIIPAAFGNMPALTTLNLKNNGFTGTIPSDILNNTPLTYLNVANNDLSGGVPVGISGMTSLKYLDLSENPWGGTCPDFSGLTELVVLSAWNCELTGPIDPSIYTLTHLQILDLAQNSLTGNIGVGIGDLTALEFLALNDNQLTGEIPAEIGDLTVLKKLNLADNLLRGVIPDAFGAETLTHIRLENNFLRGLVPQSLKARYDACSYVRLDNNYLTGGDLRAIPHNAKNFAAGTSSVQYRLAVLQSFVKVSQTNATDLYPYLINHPAIIGNYDEKPLLAPDDYEVVYNGNRLAVDVNPNGIFVTALGDVPRAANLTVEIRIKDNTGSDYSKISLGIFTETP